MGRLHLFRKARVSKPFVKLMKQKTGGPVQANLTLFMEGMCMLTQVPGLRRGHGPVLGENSWYYPEQKIAQGGLEWQDEGNLFCTSQRLVLPSDRFTFIRLDRKVMAVQAYLDGVVLQRRGEAYATYFVGGYPHETALVAAYVMARIPAPRPATPVEQT